VTFSDKKMNEVDSLDSVNAFIAPPNFKPPYDISTAAFVLTAVFHSVYQGSQKWAARLDGAFQRIERCREAVTKSSSLLAEIDHCATINRWETLFTHSEYDIAEIFSSKNSY
jgi:hypothetical protein